MQYDDLDVLVRIQIHLEGYRAALFLDGHCGLVGASSFACAFVAEIALRSWLEII